MSLIGPAEALAYVGLVVGIGLAGRGVSQVGGEGFFLARRTLSGVSVCLSLLVSELTLIAFLGMASSSYSGDHTGVQLVVGYLIGRALLAVTLLPATFNGTHQTAYQRLHMRFGVSLRRVGALMFVVIRLLRDTLVLAVGCAFLTSMTGWSPVLVLMVVAALVLGYAGLGGMAAAVRMDVVHFIVIVAAGVLLLTTAGAQAEGVIGALGAANEVGKLVGLSWAFQPSNEATLWAGLIGGASWSLASHGTDNLVVQRLLATGSLRRAGWALVGTGVLLVMATSITLMTGTVLWAGYAERSPDLAAALLAFLESPEGSEIRGWVVAAVLAGLASTLASSAIATGASAVFDFLSPSIDGQARVGLGISRGTSVAWLALLVVLGVSAPTTPEFQTVVLDVTSILYAVLLGTFVVSGLRRADPMRGSPGSFLLQRFDILVAMVVGFVATTWLVLDPLEVLADLAWPWRVPLGATLTVGVGLMTRTARKAVHDPTH